MAMKKKESKLTKLNRIIDQIISGINKFIDANNKNTRKRGRQYGNYNAGDRNFNRITRGLNKATGTNHDYSILTNKRANFDL